MVSLGILPDLKYFTLTAQEKSSLSRGRVTNPCKRCQASTGRALPPSDRLGCRQ